MHEANLTISDKTVVIATDNSMAKKIAKGLNKVGIPARMATKAVDLGCDAAAGRIRSRCKARDRMKKAAKRSMAIGKVRRIAKLRRAAQGLWRTGSSPQALYGHQQMGVP
eukprot:4608502-Pyramimonas_sp.AAC.1